MDGGRLIGTWKLQSLQSRTADGETTYPWGEEPVGYIMYSADGFVSVIIMEPERPRFSSGDLRGAPQEMALAYQSCLAYCGRYEVRGDSMTHHILACTFPNWVGVDQHRILKLDDDTLVLSTPPILIDGVERTSVLVWRRALVK